MSLSVPNLTQPYPEHIEELATVGVRGVLVHICSSWFLNNRTGSDSGWGEYLRTTGPGPRTDFEW